MAELKRHRFFPDDSGGMYPEVNKDGLWCLHSDVAAQDAENVLLRKTLGALDRDLTAAKEANEVLEHDLIHARETRESALSALQAATAAIDRQAATLATRDRELGEVRAAEERARLIFAGFKMSIKGSRGNVKFSISDLKYEWAQAASRYDCREATPTPTPEPEQVMHVASSFERAIETVVRTAAEEEPTPTECTCITNQLGPDYCPVHQA